MPEAGLLVGQALADQSPNCPHQLDGFGNALVVVGREEALSLVDVGTTMPVVPASVPRLADLAILRQR